MGFVLEIYFLSVLKYLRVLGSNTYTVLLFDLVLFGFAFGALDPLNLVEVKQIVGITLVFSLLLDRYPEARFDQLRARVLHTGRIRGRRFHVATRRAVRVAADVRQRAAAAAAGYSLRLLLSLVLVI